MTESSHDLVDFMQAMSREMAAEYHRIRKRSSEDPGTAGDQGEENWASLLRDWLPPVYQIVTKGRILGFDGPPSPQVDVLVLGATYPQHLIDKKLYLAGGVLAAFECKTTLRAGHLEAAMKTAVAIQRLVPARTGTPYRELFSPVMYGLLAHSSEWQAPFEQIGKRVLGALSESDRAVVHHPRQLLDCVCIADVGLWSVRKTPWLGPKTFNKGDPDAAAHYGRGPVAFFGLDGCATTDYVSAVLSDERGSVDPRFTPIGAMLSFLLRRLAREDANVRSIASYFRRVQMEGGGPGIGRRWSAGIYSDDIRRDVMEGTNLIGVGEQAREADLEGWNEWAFSFL